MVYELHKSQRLFLSEGDAVMYKGVVDCVIDESIPSDNIKDSLFYIDVKNAYSFLCSIPGIKEDHKKRFKDLLYSKITSLTVGLVPCTLCVEVCWGSCVLSITCE